YLCADFRRYFFRVITLTAIYTVSLHDALPISVPSKKMKKIKEDSGGGGGRGIFGKITRKLAWVFSGIIFAGIFFWGLVEIALYGATPNVSFGGLVGKFSIDRFLLLGGIVALIPPAIVYLA